MVDIGRGIPDSVERVLHNSVLERVLRDETGIRPADAAVLILPQVHDDGASDWLVQAEIGLIILSDNFV